MLSLTNCTPTAEERAAKAAREMAIFDSIAQAESAILTREKAKQIIVKFYNLPGFDTRRFIIEDRSFTSNSTIPGFEKLRDEGLLTFNVDPNGWSGGVFGQLTEKGKQFYVKDENDGDNTIKNIFVKVSILDFGEVTGIREFKEYNTAQVEFTLKVKDITPFGRIIYNMTESTENRSVTLIKYDDGWRIKK